MLESKGLSYELLTEFGYKLVVGKNSPLATKTEIDYADLADKTEIAHADPYVPALSLSKVKKEELPETEKRIFVFERASQFELLSGNPDTFMWVSPVPEHILNAYGLVEKDCSANNKTYKDVLICKKDYAFTDLDKAFITELCNVKRKLFGEKIK